jgi:hypothetical protein
MSANHKRSSLTCQSSIDNFEKLFMSFGQKLFDQ